MPIFTFQCPDHGDFDRWVKVDDRYISDCPICGKPCQRPNIGHRLSLVKVEGGTNAYTNPRRK